MQEALKNTENVRFRTNRPNLGPSWSTKEKDQESNATKLRKPGLDSKTVAAQGSQTPLHVTRITSPEISKLSLKTWKEQGQRSQILNDINNLK